MQHLAYDIGYFCLGALVGSLLTHRFTLARERSSHRREFKSRLRRLAEEACNTNALYLFEVYERAAKFLGGQRFAIIDDIPRWKRGRFNRLCRQFLASGGDRYSPKRESGLDDEARKREWKQLKSAMKKDLNDIADAA